MKEIFLVVGFMAAGAAFIIGVPLLNFTIGPSTNTVVGCKELKDAGYLADECFDGDGFLKDRSCRGQKLEGGK